MNQMPYDLDAERNILGNLLQDPAKLVDIQLGEHDFYHMKHQYVFLAIRKLFDSGNEVSLVTVTDYLRNNREISASDISEMVDSIIPVVSGSVDVVKKLSLARRIYKLAQRVQAEVSGAKQNGEVRDIDEILTSFQVEALGLSASNSEQRQEKLMADIVKAGIDRLEKILADPNHITGIPSGFVDLDTITGGFHNSDLIIIGARPGMGKTAWALDVIRHAAKCGYPIGMFSLEMASEQIGDRTLSATSGVNLARFRNGRLNSNDLSRAMKAAGDLYKLPVVINDNCGLNIDDLVMRALRMVQKHKIEMIVTDYLQLIESKGRSRHEEVGMIAWKLKSLAKRLNIPVIALSQLSRSVESRPDKRPMLSDLKESGDIEAHADMILFLYRDDYYNNKSTEPGITELTIAKHRNGPTGRIKLKWQEEITSFRNLAKVEEPRQHWQDM